jgi:EAL domain-containing protein (putative c-di-GMP-specific phosphodiesterase class I)
MLEITESLLLHDDENVMNGLRRLRQLGVRIAIDDFGTGYSALSYLQRVPLDVVKLDRQFTNAMNTSTQQRHLVAGIVQLCATLTLDIIAEGIETMDEYRLARQVGCAYGQGYLFSRPLLPEQALRWVADALENTSAT